MLWTAWMGITEDGAGNGTILRNEKWSCFGWGQTSDTVETFLLKRNKGDGVFNFEGIGQLWSYGSIKVKKVDQGSIQSACRQ